MFVFLVAVTIIIFISLVIVAAMHPEHSHISHYELSRRADLGDTYAIDTLRKTQYRADIESIVKLKVGLLLVITSFLMVASFSWIFGSVLVLVMMVVYQAIARTRVIKHIAHNLYGRIEPSLFSITMKLPWLMKIIRSSDPEKKLHIASRQELQHLIDESDTVLSPDEKKLVTHSLVFSDKTVASIMTPAVQIVSINKTEFLGPLTLSELHETGHNRLPVTSSDLNHVVGILYVQNMLALDVKRSVTADKAMDPHVSYIREDQTLPEALAAILRTHHHLLIVINDSRQTVGLVTIDDVLEALIGRRLVDDFDDHENIRAVAEHSRQR